MKHSPQELASAFLYNPETGRFYWRYSPKYDIPAGSEAGGKHHEGYIRIRYRGAFYPAHRLAVLFMTGAWPLAEVDHINGVRDDNRWANLRAVPKALNGLNRKNYATNKAGAKGVSWHKKLGKWRARIQKFGKRVALGCYDTKEEAREAYEKAALELYGPHKREGVSGEFHGKTLEKWSERLDSNQRPLSPQETPGG